MIDQAALLRVLGVKENWEKYRGAVKRHILTDEANEIIREMDVWYASHEEMDWDTFSTMFLIKRSNLPEEKKEYYAAVLGKMGEAPPAEEIIRECQKLDFAARVADKAQEVIDGRADIEEVSEILDEFKQTATPGEIPFVSSSLEGLLDETVRSGGFPWRLRELNVSIGPLHKGDFIIIGKRPETGGTTFLTDQLCHMIGFTDRRMIIFNNEEMGSKVQLRLYQSALGATVKDLVKHSEKAEEKYKSLGADRIMVYDAPSIHVREVEAICKQVQPAIIAFNTLPKIKGFGKENEVMRLQQLSQWARELSKKYGPVMAIWQADGTAEGKKWLEMNQLDWSKTGAIGEADAIIMIGKDNEDDKRYLSICKNKLPGGEESNDEFRHGKFPVGFDGAKGRYLSMMR